MILIDLTKPEIRIYLTLDGRSFDRVLHVKNDQTRQAFSFGLDFDVSPSPGRYNLFIADTASSQFQFLIEGYYVYEARDSEGDVIESGKLRVIGQPRVSDNIAPNNINDTLIYKPNGE